MQSKALGSTPAEVTLYALRHSNIVRQIARQRSDPGRGREPDTCVAMIEKTYSKFIADHLTASLATPYSISPAPPPDDNVAPLVPHKMGIDP